MPKEQDVRKTKTKTDDDVGLQGQIDYLVKILVDKNVLSVAELNVLLEKRIK